MAGIMVTVTTGGITVHASFDVVVRLVPVVHLVPAVHSVAAVRSDRVDRLVIEGIPAFPAASDSLAGAI